MNTTHSTSLAAELPAYTQLQREIHDTLRGQHPDWILSNGDSPTCDFYDARFAELLIQLPPTAPRVVKQSNTHQSQYEFQFQPQYQFKYSYRVSMTRDIQ